MRRLYALTRADHLRAFFALRDYLGEDAGVATAVETELERREAALEAIRQVADHLRLPAGQAMTTDQFNAGAVEKGSDWQSGQVIRAWGRWPQAMNAYRGEPAPDPARKARPGPATSWPRCRYSVVAGTHDLRRDWPASGRSGAVKLT